MGNPESYASLSGITHSPRRTTMFTRFFPAALILSAVAATAQSDPSFQLKRLTQPQVVAASATASGDFNNDGKLHFVQMNFNGSYSFLTTFLGNGDGTFPTTKISAPGI